MLKLKGIYEWRLVNSETGQVDQEGQQCNVISDRFLEVMCGTHLLGTSYSGYQNGMAIQLSDTAPGSIDYRKAGASNTFNVLATGALVRYNIDWVLKSKFTEYNFPPPGASRTIRVIGVKFFSHTTDSFPTPNFVSFIVLSTPITQTTTQYLYVKYTVFCIFPIGLGYSTPNNRFLEYTLNMNLFNDAMLVFGSVSSSSVTGSKFNLTQYLPPSNINNVARYCAPIYSSTQADTQASTGAYFARLFQKQLAVSSVVGPIGSVVFQNNYASTDVGIQAFFKSVYGYSKVRTSVPSISRVFVHPGSRNAYLFSDPSYPAVSQGAVAISGSPTNKFHVIGRISITKTGDASDIIDEEVASTSVNTGTWSIAVTQEMTTGDKYRLTTTGTLPGPLNTLTDYYIIRIDAFTIQLALSYANALAGTQIHFLSQGTGNHTLIRQNTGRYRVELEAWYQSLYTSLEQLPMAVDYDGYVMPLDLSSVSNVVNGYAEGDYVANSSISTVPNEFFTYTLNMSCSMLRGTIKKGEYIYSVQQSRKGLINNICRWLFNTIETSQPLCRFGTGTTKVSSVFSTDLYMYIATNEGVYQYTFTTPSVPPVLLAITGMIGSAIQDACMDPVTGYIWAGHVTGLSRIDVLTLTATQYIAGTGGALEGMTASNVNCQGGQLDAYNGRVLKGGDSNIPNFPPVTNNSWVLDDGVGFYRLNNGVECCSCCLHQGTDQVVWRGRSVLSLYAVTVTGKNAGTSSVIETWATAEVYARAMSHYGKISDRSYASFFIDDESEAVSEVYTIGAAPVISSSAAGATVYPGNCFGWSLGAIKRNLLDVDGNGTFVFIWHSYLVTFGFPNQFSFGWDGVKWVKDLATDRPIPKTSTHALPNGLYVDFNNATGASWDVQYASGERFNYVHGPSPIKDNLQELTIKARSYFCEAHVVEDYAFSIPGVAAYALTIPEKIDPDFRDMDTVDFITRIFEGSTRYTEHVLPTGTNFTVSTATSIFTVGANIPTGTPVRVTTTAIPPFPLIPFGIYYAINVSATTCRLATTHANALSGTFLSIASTGSGTQTIKQVIPLQGTYCAGTTGIVIFAAADAGKNLTITYTYTKHTT